MYVPKTGTLLFTFGFLGMYVPKAGTLSPPALNECKPKAKHEFSVRCVAKVAGACLRWNIHSSYTKLTGNIRYT